MTTLSPAFDVLAPFAGLAYELPPIVLHATFALFGALALALATSIGLQPLRSPGRRIRWRPDRDRSQARRTRTAERRIRNTARRSNRGSRSRLA
jgi:hypothetical protein